MAVELKDQRLEPHSGSKPRHLVVLLHGYGSSGSDLISLAPHWRPALPDALFLAPNAPERCPGAWGGYQWWNLSDFSRQALAAGARRAATVLDQYLDARLKEYGLDDSSLLLVGFSQGTMMALHVAPRRESAVAGIIGYSGMLADPAGSHDLRVKPPVLLIHGSADPIVPLTAHQEAQRELHRQGFSVDSHVSQGLGHSVDARGLELGLGFARRVLRFEERD